MFWLILFVVVIPAILDAMATSKRDDQLSANERDEAEQMILEWLATRHDPVTPRDPPAARQAAE